MITIVNPEQNTLFDPFSGHLTKRTRQALLEGWQGVFRHVILSLMPVDVVGGAFHPELGRPTKELYSMAGLMVLKEFRGWTKEETLNAYRFHLDVHYALNLSPTSHELAVRTLERYEKIFIENDLAAWVMHEVTTRLVADCGLKVDQQRLDSTHIFSNMASFGRTRMMGVTIKRFLTQVRRHDPQGYAALAEALRARYEPSTHKLFGDVAKDEKSRSLLRTQVAEDMYALVQRFANEERHTGRGTYKMLVQVFYEQCEVVEEKVTVKKKPGGNVVQNPSDPDATYDGHKGSGYQVQIAETCNPENEVQLITSALPQTAAVSDMVSLSPVLDDLEEHELLPESLLADAGYGSDDNTQDAERRGVELVSPTKEGATELLAPVKEKSREQDDALTVDDFAIDEETEAVTCCPAGFKPESCTHDSQTGKTVTFMPATACHSCDFSGACPIEKVKGQYRLVHTPKDRRLAQRRREEKTAVFRERYQLRAGIEGTNSGIKRRVGLARLRVRGEAHVFNAILLKLVGWNILRAAACTKMRELVAERARTASCGAQLDRLWRVIRHSAVFLAIQRSFFPQLRVFGQRAGLRPAA